MRGTTVARFRIRALAVERGILNATELVRRTGIGYNVARAIWLAEDPDRPTADPNLETATLEKIASAFGVDVPALYAPRTIV